MKQSFKPSGVCSQRIDYDVDENNLIHNVRFLGGCAGNSVGISALIEGMTVEEAIRRLSGINCRNGTSCPDQLARALKKQLQTDSATNNKG